MEARFKAGFFALPVLGGLYLEGLITTTDTPLIRTLSIVSEPTVFDCICFADRGEGRGGTGFFPWLDIAGNICILA